MRLHTVRKDLDVIRERCYRSFSEEDHIIISDDFHITFGNPNKDKEYTYIPSSTGIRFHSDDESRTRQLMGPVGSGKTVMCCMEILKMACFMKPGKDGIRRSRGAIIRKTYADLKRSVFNTWMDWFGLLGFEVPKTKESSPLEFKALFRFRGVKVELEIEFIGLDEIDGIKKLMSTEYTYAYINESRDYSTSIIYDNLQGRIGRYPAAKSFEDGQAVEGRIIMDTNPPDTDSWLYDLFEVKRPESHILLRQPPGLIQKKDGTYIENDKAENTRNLPKNYYISQAAGKDRDYIKVQLMGEYGIFNQGDPVYKDYTDDLHSLDGIKVLEGIDVIIGMDFGLTPAASFCQLTPSGHLNVFKEIVSFNMNLREFLDSKLMPYVSSKLKGMNIIVCPDPSAVRREDSDGSSCVSVLESYGFKVDIPKTNQLDPRLSAVKFFLTRLIDGKPCLQLDRAEAPYLRKGFVNKYALVNKYGKKEPDKNEYSHVHDSLQYPCMYYYNSLRVNKVVNYQSKFIKHDKVIYLRASWLNIIRSSVRKLERMLKNGIPILMTTYLTFLICIILLRETRYLTREGLPHHFLRHLNS